MYHIIGRGVPSSIKQFSSLNRCLHHSCKVLVVGGGTGGCSMAAKLSKCFSEPPNHVIVIEPSETHYYQPLFTLVGGGIKSFASSKQSMKSVLPKKAQWLKARAKSFFPEKNKVETDAGDTIQYEVLILAMGLELYWNKLPGLQQALENKESQVCSIYGPHTVPQVYDVIRKTKEGNAIFTFPNTPVKCPGAPQKILYLSEEYWQKSGNRKKIKVMYNTSLPVLFAVNKYAEALWKVCNEKDIQVNLTTNLIEIKPDSKEAIFQDLKNPDKKQTMQYSMLHVTPPMGPPEILKAQKDLVNEAGFLNVSPETLQHVKYKNVFGLGDCTNTPNSKTMAAIASQSKVLHKNVMDYLSDKKLNATYDGYASCPLVTGHGKCILAEFDYKLKPKETFPVNQAEERQSMYLLKKYFFPYLYWNYMLKGNWSGPEFYRKLFSILKLKDKST